MESDMHRTALGRSSLPSSSSASGREPLSEYAHATTLRSRPSAAPEATTARSACRSGEVSVGIGHERAALRRVELALDGADQLLVPEVGEASDEQPHHGGGSAGQ